MDRARRRRIGLFSAVFLSLSGLTGTPAVARGLPAVALDHIDLGAWVGSAPGAFAGATPVHFSIGTDTSGGSKVPKLVSFVAMARCTVVPGSPNPPYPKPKVLTFKWADTKAFDQAHGPVDLSPKSSGGETNQTDGNAMDEEFSFPSPSTATGWFTATYDYPSGAWTCFTGRANNVFPKNLRVTFTAHHV